LDASTNGSLSSKRSVIKYIIMLLLNQPEATMAKDLFRARNSRTLDQSRIANQNRAKRKRERERERGREEDKAK